MESDLVELSRIDAESRLVVKFIDRPLLAAGNRVERMEEL